jgi:putative transcriptional regulator
MSNEIPELTDADFARMITRAQRKRLIAGTFEAGDLVALRRFLNLTQAELAERIGISVDSLQNWEQDRRQPDGPARALFRLIAKHPRLILDDLATPSK